MALSRTSKIAILFMVTVNTGVMLARVRQDIYVDGPFNKATEDFMKALKIGDVESEYDAIRRQNEAMCNDWFLPSSDRPKYHCDGNQ